MFEVNNVNMAAEEAFFLCLSGEKLVVACANGGTIRTCTANNLTEFKSSWKYFLRDKSVI